MMDVWNTTNIFWELWWLCDDTKSLDTLQTRVPEYLRDGWKSYDPEVKTINRKGCEFIFEPDS